MADNTFAGLLRTPDGATFLNPAMMAPNVFEIEIDQKVIAELAPFAQETKSMEEAHKRFTLSNGVTLYNEKPGKWHSDICWLSHADVKSFKWFEGYFDRLGLAEKVASFVPHDRVVRLYAGFFVTRSQCDELDMHCDWLTDTNHAFTLMTPLTPNASGLGMTYNTVRGESRSFDYHMGRGLVFGPRFLHSTSVGRLDERAVFLCFNFGTDRMENWKQIGVTTAKQCELLRQPDGSFTSQKNWLRTYNGQAAY